MAINELIYRIPKKKILWMVLLSVLLSTIFFFSDCSTGSKQESYLNHADSVSYVGIETCATCHEDKAASFRHTGMGMSFSTATKAHSSADFKGQHLVYDSATRFYYQPYLKATEIWVKEFLLHKSDTIHQLDIKIDYIVGSGQHTNSHLLNRNGYVYQAPLTFYTQEGRWDLPPGFENGNNARFNRMIDVECMSCHNSMPQMEENSNRKFASIGNGIDCERCHGPGELHVKRRTSGEEFDENEIDRSIVNPSDLSFDIQMDLCQRCHLQGLNLLKPQKSFTDFKPGMALSSVFDVYLPQYNSTSTSVFDMANHSAQLQKSQCFIQSSKNGKQFNCISCHDPHQSVNQTSVNHFNSKCIDCHAVTSLSASEQHIAEANCVDCHMPLSKSADVLHVKVHNHQIAKPISVQQEEEVMELIGLYAVNNPSPKEDELTMAYMLYWEKFDKNPFFLNQAKARINNQSTPALRLKYHFLSQNYTGVIDEVAKLEETDYWQAYMVGESYLQLNQLDKAMSYLQLSYSLNSDQVEVAERLLEVQLKANQLSRVTELANEMAVKFPLSGAIKNAWAEALIKQGEIVKAQALMTEALHLEPLSLAVWETHLNAAIIASEGSSVLYWAERILTSHPNHPSKDQIRRQSAVFR